MGCDVVQVGTFLATEPIGDSDVLRRQPRGTLPVADRDRCLRLLSDLEGVEFHHGLNIDRTHIRNGRVYLDHGRCLNDLDLYVWYAQVDRSPYSFHLEALRTLAHDTQVVISPDSFATGVDKYRSHLTLRRAGVNVADTVLFQPHAPAAVEGVLEQWGRAVLKPRWGCFGQGVLFIDDFRTLRDVAGYLAGTAPAAADGTMLLERWYDNDPADWRSVTVVNGAILYGYRKRPSRWAKFGPGAIKVYDGAGVGGEADLCDVPPAHAKQALRAQQALGSEIIGFDMIVHDDTPVIVDENTFPGLYPGLISEAGGDLAEAVFRLVADAIDNLRGPS